MHVKIIKWGSAGVSCTSEVQEAQQGGLQLIEQIDCFDGCIDKLLPTLGRRLIVYEVKPSVVRLKGLHALTSD
ncbi:Uncharacterized protein DAT39_013211 [Clarias magur]|uniref:Uncharacterized protein n=1 Tax=Clarias magur TaxID=1594786 RepID=A0A8J4UKZ1_CLAMG|nr:Uncharacterized protein DAT39_013211 [Clarias magur]